MATISPELSTRPAHSYILLESAPGYDRGQLLELVKAGEHSRAKGEYSPHSHGVSPRGHNNILLSSDVAPLTEAQCYILDAIYLAGDRYTVYSTPGRLTWGVGLKVGDTVLARLPRLLGREKEPDIYSTAIIRWCGDIQMGIFGSTRLFGVEIVVCTFVSIPYSL